jgi:hypothetical protein
LFKQCVDTGIYVDQITKIEKFRWCAITLIHFQKTKLVEDDGLIIRQDGKIVIFPADRTLLRLEMIEKEISSNRQGEEDLKSEGN